MLTIDPAYIPLLKNIRGILLGTGSENEYKSLDWLAKNFRYHEFGVPPAQWQSISQKGKIRHIKSPFPECEIFLERIAQSVDTELSTVEAIAFAAMFASPLILLSQCAAERVRKFAIYVFRAEIFKNSRELGFSLRSCDSAASDMFAKFIQQAQKTLSGEIDINNVVMSRRTSAKEDGRKRFWRLGDGTQGNPLVLYLDLLQIIVKMRTENFQNCPITSIVPAICIEIA